MGVSASRRRVDEQFAKRVIKNKFNLKTFSCTNCDMKLTQESNLRREEIVHTGAKQVGLLVDLITNEKTQSDVDPFSCSHCGKNLKDKSKLERHERIHTGEKPFICSKCKKTFSRNDHVKIHERKCDEKFSTKDYLKTHEKTQ